MWELIERGYATYIMKADISDLFANVLPPPFILKAQRVSSQHNKSSSSSEISHTVTKVPALSAAATPNASLTETSLRIIWTLRAMSKYTSRLICVAGGWSETFTSVLLMTLSISGKLPAPVASSSKTGISSIVSRGSCQHAAKSRYEKRGSGISTGS